MKTPFCDYHIASFFTQYLQKKSPLDLALSKYFKAHKSLGSKDRKIIGDTVYGMVRWKSLIDHLCSSPEHLDRIHCYKNLDWKNIPIRFALPEWLYSKLVKDFGEMQAQKLCKIFNTEAPVTIRANLLKTTRNQLLERLQGHPTKHAPHGIQFAKRLPLFSYPEFKEGLFEVQDEGSQMVSLEVAAKPGDIVLDYCSGSGGKTLAFAHLMQGRGQIYLHDIRPQILVEAKQRLKRAGIQNAQIVKSTPAHLKGKCDWVLIDVPCSGTGTLRRNPDQKWNLDQAAIDRLIIEQRTIAKEAIYYLKPNGKLVYATCSILKEENEAQVKHFLETLPLHLEKPPSMLFPQEGGMDGFFVATFKKNGYDS